KRVRLADGPQGRVRARSVERKYDPPDRRGRLGGNGFSGRDQVANDLAVLANVDREGAHLGPQSAKHVDSARLDGKAEWDGPRLEGVTLQNGDLVREVSESGERQSGRERGLAVAGRTRQQDTAPSIRGEPGVDLQEEGMPIDGDLPHANLHEGAEL